MKRKGFDGSATILPLGIDSSLYSPDVRSSSLRESWKASNNDIVIGYLGRLVEEKGLDTLLDALARIPPSLSWQLVVVGSGPNERSFDDKARRFGLTPKIERVGYVSHDSAPKYLASFDILVVPSETQSSWKEQFGRVIIEALACGTPVIGSDSGEIPNLIKDTEGGLIFAERNPEALANCLRTLMHNPEKRRTLAERGRRVVHRDYTLSTLANQFATAIGQSVSA
jgi:glycosyltransferase involved in cell wall biosynthesis